MQFLPSAFLCLLLASCGHIHTKSQSYQLNKAANVNGARVITEVKPMGGKPGFSVSAMVYMAGSASLEGPFKWRVQAIGKQGVHQYMHIHSVSMRTAHTKRHNSFPRSQLPSSIPFVSYKKTPGVVYAVHQFPGLLEVYPQTDGPVTVTINVSIRSHAQSERKIITGVLKPTQQSETEFLFIPTEIAQSFGQRDPRSWSF